MAARTRPVSAGAFLRPLAFSRAMREAGGMATTPPEIRRGPAGGVLPLRGATVRLARPDELSRWDEQVDRAPLPRLPAVLPAGDCATSSRGASGGSRSPVGSRARSRAAIGTAGSAGRGNYRYRRLYLIANNTRFVILSRPVGLPASRLLGAGPDDATAQRGLGGAVRPPLAGRRELRRPGPVYRHLLPGRELAVSRPYPQDTRATTASTRNRTGSPSSSTSTPCGATPASGCATRVRCPPPGSRKGRRRRRRPACASLYEELAAVPDFRRAQGRKHTVASVLADYILARLANCRGPVAAAEYAQQLSQAELQAIGAWKSPRTGRYVPVSKSTLHRVIGSVDPERGRGRAAALRDAPAGSRTGRSPSTASASAAPTATPPPDTKPQPSSRTTPGCRSQPSASTRTAARPRPSEPCSNRCRSPGVCSPSMRSTPRARPPASGRLHPRRRST